jgi:N-methylhydantoinase A/oxoprolinase/acetone carboxylase beta subunit
VSLHLGLDTGGTYTDAVLFDPATGVIAAAKSLTTKQDLSQGLTAAVEAILPQATAPIDLVSVSTTLATNALVEGHGSPICLLLAGYDAKSLERAGLGEALRGDPAVFLAGGHGATGDEQCPLDIEAARRAIAEHAPRAAAFAVSGFFSVRNPAHEIALKALVREMTGLPVTCGHELTSKLDAPRRALTAALNARLIPQLQHLMEAVRALLSAHGIAAPLMVVKGDGSLISAELAMSCPVETILSGPAASVVGARYLSGEHEVFVSDMGGTTTDVALLRGGRPVLNPDGAVVGGWRTMVEAVAVYTYGLGGDSEVRLDEAEGLVVGPRRAMPLSLLAQQHPGVLETMREQLDREPKPAHGRFALRLRALDAGQDSLSTTQRQLWERLGAGPVPLTEIESSYAVAQALIRLADRGLVIVAAFTPSDAAHLLGRQSSWSLEGARLGAALWLRRPDTGGWSPPPSPEAFAAQVAEAVVVQSGRAILSTALAERGDPPIGQVGSLGRLLVDRALAGRPDGDGLFAPSLGLHRPVVAIGAPVGAYYSDVAQRLGTRSIIPAHADVCNAVGAVAGGIMQTVNVVITSPSEGRFRAHLPDGVVDFFELESAAAHAEKVAGRLALEQARRAGADDPQVDVTRADNVVTDRGGGRVFIESKIAATAVGRPRLAAE